MDTGTGASSADQAGASRGAAKERVDGYAAPPRCMLYCRTKHIVPLNWDFYRARHGWIEGSKEWRRRRRQAAKSGHRAMFFRDCGERLREFVRLDPWEAAYLTCLAVRARRGILEIGRFKGGSTLALALANGEVPIVSIDIAPVDDERLRSVLVEHEVGRNVHLLIGDSRNGQFAEAGPDSYDLLFVDGDHSYEGCLADLERWWPGLAVGGSVVLHDCYQGNEVQQAVDAFFGRNKARFVRSTSIPGAHWLTSEGSLAHAVKICPRDELIDP